MYPVGARERAEEEEQERERQTLAVRERHSLELPTRSMKGCDLAKVAYCYAEAIEVADQIVGHRLAQIHAAMQQRDERAAAAEPYGGLGCRVSSPNDAHPLAPAELRLRRRGRVENGYSLVLRQVLDGRPPVVRPG